MAFELIYTSVPQGIRPGSSGFCIVAYTNGLAANIALQLEGLSAYKPSFPHYDANADKNPVAFSHYLYKNSGEDLHILSRVCFNGLDYTKRSNKLAHHIVMKSGERSGAPSGPSSVFKQEDLSRTGWTGGPQLFPNQIQINAPVLNIHRAETWEAYTGDAGWAGVLVQRFMKKPDKPAFIIFDPLKNENILELVEEALLLLPENMRWKVSFNTYFTTLPAGILCLWRFCVPGSDALKEARRTPDSLVLDLTKPMPKAPDGELQNIARTGVIPEKKVPVADSQESFSDERGLNAEQETELPNAPGESEKIKLKVSNPTPSQKHRFIPVRSVAPGKSGGHFRAKIILLICAILFFFLCVGGGVFAYIFLKRSLMPPPLKEDELRELPISKTHKVQAEAPKPVKKTELPPKTVETPQTPAAHSEKRDKTAESIASAEVEKKKLEEKRAQETLRKLNEQEELRKKKEIAVKAAERKRILRCESLWMDSKIADLLKPGGKYEFDVLTPGDTVEFVFIKDLEKGFPVDKGVVSAFTRVVMKNRTDFQYQIKVNGPKVSIENQMTTETAKYPIVELLTKKGKHIYLSFVPGKCKIPEENQAQISITVHPNQNWTAEYEKTALDNEAGKRNPELFANAFIQFNVDNIRTKSTHLSNGDKATAEISKESGLVKSYLDICKKVETAQIKLDTLNALLKMIDEDTFKKEVTDYYKNLGELINSAKAELPSDDYDALVLKLKMEKKEMEGKLAKLNDSKFPGSKQVIDNTSFYFSKLSRCKKELQLIDDIKRYHESQKFAEKVTQKEKISDLAYNYPLSLLFVTEKLKAQGKACCPVIQFNKPLNSIETLKQICAALEKKKKEIPEKLKRTPMHIMMGNNELKTVRKIKIEVK